MKLMFKILNFEMITVPLKEVMNVQSRVLEEKLEELAARLPQPNTFPEIKFRSVIDVIPAR